jgi:DNA-binding transcriptional MerR regulator
MKALVRNNKKARSERGERTSAVHDPLHMAYTSREASELSGVPFFTIDYWGRTKFLIPTVAQGAGRGKGRQRMYSYGDILRLRIARELRDQRVSLESLRAIITKLGPYSSQLARTRFVLVGRTVEIATSTAALMAILRRRQRHTFGVLIDLRAVVGWVAEQTERNQPIGSQIPKRHRKKSATSSRGAHPATRAAKRVSVRLPGRPRATAKR